LQQTQIQNTALYRPAGLGFFWRLSNHKIKPSDMNVEKAVGTQGSLGTTVMVYLPLSYLHK
jgi:hypothetical protein